VFEKSWLELDVATVPSQNPVAKIAQLKLLIDQNSNLCKNLQEASEHKVYSIHVYLYILPSCGQVIN
jgi:hypothetical protein